MTTFHEDKSGIYQAERGQRQFWIIKQERFQKRFFVFDSLEQAEEILTKAIEALKKLSVPAVRKKTRKKEEEKNDMQKKIL